MKRQAALTDSDDRVLDQKDGVLGDDPHQHDQADHRRQAKFAVEDQQSEERAADRERDRGQDGDRLYEILEQQDQHAIDAQDPDHDRHDESAARSEEHTSELQSLMRISYAVY